MSTCCRHLALAYATNHKNMANPTRRGCGDDGYNFGKQSGITNGAAWYSVQGGRFVHPSETFPLEINQRF